MRALLASPLGFLIGLSLGALGGGGSILAVPALVYAAGQTPKQATTTSLILVAITAVMGIVPHWRNGKVRWAAGTVFGLTGIGGSLLGTHWNKSVNPNALLLAFAALMVVAAWAMCRRNPLSCPMPSPRALNMNRSGTTVVATRVDAATALKVAVLGTGVGLLTGFFGVGGGFVIVPALVLALDFPMPEAVGTSLLVITINSLMALATRFQGGSIEWKTVVPFTVASLAGVVAGGRMAEKRDPSSLQRYFVMLLIAVAAYTAVRSAIDLW
ncbi:MAG: sulfite exporter TauE/SafE family protein [Acidimicrobiia bacterium]